MNQGYGAYVAIESKITGHWQHCHKQFHMAMDRDLTQFFNWLDQSILYSIPDEIGSFADCSLNSYVIQCLNKDYSQDNLNKYQIH